MFATGIPHTCTTEEMIHVIKNDSFFEFTDTIYPTIEMMKYVKSVRMLQLLIDNGLDVSSIRFRHINADNLNIEMIRILVGNGLSSDFFEGNAFSMSSQHFQYLTKRIIARDKLQ